MTFHLPASSAGNRPNFDSGPLSWVMDEIREALNQSRTALQNAMVKDSDASATLLNHAGAYLHQAHGALQIVDVDGATIITEAVEDILRRISVGDIRLTRANQRIIEHSYQALVEYLDELLAGEPPQPIRLFPYYKDLQEIRGAERIHPADLFFPSLDSQALHTPVASSLENAIQVSLDVKSLRPRFEKALLALLTSSTAPADNKDIADLLNVVIDIEHAQSGGKARDFWWVMHGFIDMVASSKQPLDLFAKLVCCRMNRQIRLLAQGSSSISDRLLLDALYCLARQEAPSSLAEEIRKAYHLQDAIPADFETKRYGQIDTVALGLAKAALTQAKNTWHRVTKDEAGAAVSFSLLIRQLINATNKLNSAPLSTLLKAVNTTSENLKKSVGSHALGLEIATDLLFIENALDHLNRMPEDFAKRVDALVSRLESVAAGETPPASSQWLDDLTQQSQQRQTIVVLAAEMEGGLRQVEALLDAYFKDSTKYALLSDIDPVLHQIAGVLSILGQEHAMLAVQHTQATIRAFRESVDAASDEAKANLEFPPTVTQNITALGFFVEVLPQHPESARTRFTFDRAQGILHANLLERGVPRPAALTSADPSFDPLLDVEDGAQYQTKPLTAPVMPYAVKTEPSAPLPETDEEIDAELLDIFMSEAEEVLSFVKHAVPDARANASDQDRLSTLRRSFHTLKGSGRMVGLTSFAEAAYSVEQVMNLWLAEARTATPDLFALLDTSVDELGQWVADLRTAGKSSRTPAELSKAAERVKAGQAFSFGDADQEALTTSPTNVTPAHDDNPSPQINKSKTSHAIANVIEFPLAVVPSPEHDDNIKRIGHLEVSVPLFNIYVAEADDLLRHLSQDFSEWRHEPNRPVSAKAIHAAHSLAGSSATVGISSLQDVAHALELYLQTLEYQPMALSQAEFDSLQLCVDRIRQMLQQVAVSELPSAQPDLLQLLDHLRQTAAMPAASAPTLMEADSPPNDVSNRHSDKFISESSDAVVIEDDDDEATQELKDSLDQDLLPVFLDEGRELLPQIGLGLRTWLNAPEDTTPVPDILRQLHTAKGSARMAGAMSLGEYLHLMETQIESILSSGSVNARRLEDLLSLHDYNTQLFDHLQNPNLKKPAPFVSATRLPVQDATASLAEHALSAPAKRAGATSLKPPSAATPVARVRVRADILDRLVNQAGEVSIARSKIENEVDTLRHSLSDLTENLSRLRSQLREVEIQAESQIASRAQAADREFDPLEFDRFSRLQELTRMMTESVDDVASIQDSLVRTVTGATSDLENQAQLTRSLQQDLMQVRMVPFASISERLYQITRQTSKEVGKSVNLDIKGTSVEVDRSVLERMIAPLEHLLRNAIVHGIESRADRKNAGKNETGELLVEIRQEGNEVVILLSDDGRGLDLARIRERGLAAGLITPERELSDPELENLVFQTGFSTAGEVTALAGRGIGLDVVRAEAASLGGRVNVSTTPGKGTRFTINLPLTLAVTSVVLLQSGGSTYAVPSVLVEQVQQLTNKLLQSAYGEGAIMWQSSRVPIFFLSSVLGDTQSTPVVQQYTPVLILRSGSDRVAIHVDEIIGNREVVVKNIGPQLARMIGIVGATVLGSGNIVLIMDPVPLAQRLLHEDAHAARMHAAAMAEQAVSSGSDTSTNAPLSTADSTQVQESIAEPVQGLRKKNIVMVVDDSLTVRRVTQRFLQREGYQVILAKDGVDALEKLQEVKPDVMLVDIEMPRMDGFDLIRNVRSDSRIAKTPIIMITSRTASKHRNYAMELGANEYYGKPFQENQLLESIEEFVGKASEPTS